MIEGGYNLVKYSHEVNHIFPFLQVPKTIILGKKLLLLSQTMNFSCHVMLINLILLLYFIVYNSLQLSAEQKQIVIKSHTLCFKIMYTLC